MFTYFKNRKGDVKVVMGMISLIVFFIWFLQIQEFLKPEKKQSNRKIIILTSAGTGLTLILTVWLFQNIPF